MKSTKSKVLVLNGMIIFFIGLFFISCNRDLGNDEKIPSMTSSLTDGNSSLFAKGTGEDLEIDTVFVVDETRNAMISFTSKVKPFYEVGRT